MDSVVCDIRGKLRFLDECGLKEVLQKTSLHFEKGEIDSPTVYNNLPGDYLDRLTKAIVAFEIEVKEIDNVFKLSQNRDEESYHNIIDNLRNEACFFIFLLRLRPLLRSSYEHSA